MESATEKQAKHEARSKAFAKYERALRKSIRMARDHSITDATINAYIRAARDEYERGSR